MLATRRPFRLVSFVEQERGPAALARALEENDRTVLFDVASDADLGGIGDGLRGMKTDRPLLLIGSSSVAECLVAAQSDGAATKGRPVEPDALDHLAGRSDGVFVFAGSRSALTSEHNASGFALAQWSATFVEAVCRVAPPAALAIAGGDTSGAAVRQLGFARLSYLGDLDRVPLCVGHSSDPERDGTMLMLKGGQIGGTDLFERFAGLPSETSRRAGRSSSGADSDA